MWNLQLLLKSLIILVWHVLQWSLTSWQVRDEYMTGMWQACDEYMKRQWQPEKASSWLPLTTGMSSTILTIENVPDNYKGLYIQGNDCRHPNADSGVGLQTLPCKIWSDVFCRGHQHLDALTKMLRYDMTSMWRVRGEFVTSRWWAHHEYVTREGKPKSTIADTQMPLQEWGHSYCLARSRSDGFCPSPITLQQFENYYYSQKY